MELGQVIAFLEKNHWTTIGSNDRFIFMQPPKELGFEKGYSISVPVKKDAYDYPDYLNRTIQIIGQIYEKAPEELFFDVGNYQEILKKDAIFLKLSSREVLFRNTLEISHIWSFLRDLNASYNSFIEVRFRQLFSELFNFDEKRIKKVIQQILNFGKLRLVDLEYQSFSFGVNADTIMGKEFINQEEIRQWRKQVVPEYNKTVIEGDYSSSDFINGIIEKFNEEEREKIYKPVINNFNKKEFSISITDRDFDPKNLRRIERIPNSTVHVILPPKPKEKEEYEIGLVQMVVPLDKSKSRITLKVKDIENDLFTKAFDEITLTIEELPLEDKEVHFAEPISYSLRLDKKSKLFIITFSEFDVEIQVGTIDKAKTGVLDTLREYYNRFTELSDTDYSDLEDEERALVDFFRYHLEG